MAARWTSPGWALLHESRARMVRSLSSQAWRPRPATTAPTMRRRPRRVDGITPFSWMQNTNDVLEQGGVALNRPPGLAAAEGTARHARRARPHPELPPLPLELMLEAIYREPANDGSLHSRTGDANLLSLAHTVEAQSFWRELSEPERTHYVVQAATAAKAYNVKIRKFYARPQTVCDDAKIALERWVAKRMSLNARLTMRKIVGAIAEGQSRGCGDRYADEAEAENPPKPTDGKTE